MAEDPDVLRLWGACYSGNVDLVQELIDDDVDYMQKDKNGETVLHMAARSDNADVLNLLLDHLSPDTANNNDQTPLHMASSRGHTKVIDILTKADCKLDNKTKFSEMTALHLACQYNHRHVVSALLEAGAVCNLPDTIGKPPRHYATDPQIERLFDEHSQHCTHDEAEDGLQTSNTQQSSNVFSSTKHQQDDTALTIDSDDDDNDDEDDNAASRKWKQAVRKQKQLKINHGLKFSTQHKRRMEMNVFDRLMGNKKK